MVSDKLVRNRRKFLKQTGAVSAAAVAGLAGCNGLGDSESPDVDDVAEEKFPRVALPDDTAASLERTGEITQVTDVTGVTAYTAGDIYEVTALSERVSSQTMGTFSDSLMTFFAAKSNLEGLGTAAATPTRIAENSKAIVEQRLREQGIEDAREVEPSGPTPDVPDGHTIEFRGTYRTPGIEQTAELPNGETLPIEIPPKDLAVVGMLTVWKEHKGLALMGGGGYPAENYEETVTSSLTAGQGEGIDVTVSIDLGLEPASLRNRLNGLVESIS